MYHLRLKGDHYQMGVKRGTIFQKGNISFPLHLDAFQLEHGKQSEQILKKYFPEVCEEIRGVSDTIGADYLSFASWMDKLCVVDHYPSDRFTFSSHGYDLHIENELVADAFAGLSVQEQSILILHFVLDLPDQEVGRLVGMSRSAVQRRRAKSLTELRIKLAALMPKGG